MGTDPVLVQTPWVDGLRPSGWADAWWSVRLVEPTAGQGPGWGGAIVK